MKAIIDNKIPFIQGQIEKLVDEALYLPGSAITASDVRDADILVVRTRTKCNRQLLEGSAVKFIVTATIGYDHIDTDYCRQAGIRWTNCPGCNARSVCQYVTNAIALLGIKSEGTTIGIVGVGHVGSLIARAAVKDGFNVLMSDPPQEEGGITAADIIDTAADNLGNSHVCRFASLAEICSSADIITFHTPLTHSGKYPTYHLADTDFFSRLTPGTVIINASRGGVVDESALKKALTDGTVAHAVIDTWEGEPRIDPELLTSAAIATPHVAGYSANGKRNATLMSLGAVRQFLLDTTKPATPLYNKYAEATFDIPLPSAPYLTPQTLADDSRRLKENIDGFEDFRGNYPRRIEYEE